MNELLQFLKHEEITKCQEVAEEMLRQYESADDVPAWAVKDALMKKFDFLDGTHEDAVRGMAEDVFTMMHEA